MSWIPLEVTNERISSATKRRVRFLVDESLGVEAARVLREHGWNAKFVSDLQLIGKDDRTVFAMAWRERRVILTHDRDFLDNRKFPPHRNPGVVVFVVGASGEDDERLIRAFALMQIYLKTFGANYMLGTKIVFSDDEHVTIERRQNGGLRTMRYWMPKRGQAMEWVST
jgi:predicted nuclease of predicted toxin-antitoxin system